MINKLLFSIILATCFSNVSSQHIKPLFKQDLTYTIESIEGTLQNIRLHRDYLNNLLIISHDKDTINIGNCLSINGKISILSRYFLKVSYRVKIGTNIRVNRMLLLCVERNKLHSALHITQLSSYTLDQLFDSLADTKKLFDEKSRYDANLTLLGENIGDFRLVGDIDDKNVSRLNPGSDYHVDNSTLLKFDKNENVFISNYEKVDRSLPIYYAQDSVSKMTHLRGTYPVVSLGKMKYLFIGEEWFEETTNEFGTECLIEYAWTDNASKQLIKL
jgi:hypothetical protein